MEGYFYQFFIEYKDEGVLRSKYFKYFADEGISEEEIIEWEKELIEEMDLISCKFVSQGYER